MVCAIALAAAGLLVAVLAMLFVFPKHFVALLLLGTRRLFGFKTRSIDVDGIAWPYLEGGPESGEPIVLLHGFGGDKDNWPLYARFLRGKYRVVIPDLPGFGENAKDPDSDYGIDPQAKRLHRFIQSMGIDKFHIGGHSMGGFLALKYALERPSHVITITLLNNAGVSSLNKSEVELAAERGESLLVISSLEEFDRLIDFIMHKPIPLPRFIKREIGKLAVAQKSFWESIFWSLFNDSKKRPLDDQLHEIIAPTLIMWGRHDRVIDVSCTDVMKSKIPVNHCVVFEDAGHVPILECPAQSASVHLDFLSQHLAA